MCQVGVGVGCCHIKKRTLRGGDYLGWTLFTCTYSILILHHVYPYKILILVIIKYEASSC